MYVNILWRTDVVDKREERGGGGKEGGGGEQFSLPQVS